MNQFKKGIAGAEHTWMAAIGPGIKALGEVKGDQILYNNQIAATALTLLGYSPDDFDAEAGEALHLILTED